MSEKKNGTGQKRAYKKPRLRTINLAAEEVLAVGCKTPVGVGANTLCSNLVCSSTLGS